MKKLSNEELCHFCEQYSLILRSGISSVEGLRILSDDSPTPEGKKFLEGLLANMEVNGDLSVTLEDSGVFPSSMISSVRLGEQTGCLDEVFEILTRYYEQEIETASAIRSAVAYPLMMLGMMVAVIVILLIKVLPVLSQVFRQMGMEMSGISAGMLRFGQNLQRYSYVFPTLSVEGQLTTHNGPSGTLPLAKGATLPGELPLSLEETSMTNWCLCFTWY